MAAIANGYKIQLARNTGGKAGFGCNKTSSVQCVDRQNVIRHQVRFTIGKPLDLDAAYKKAVSWCFEHSPGGVVPLQGVDKVVSCKID